MLHDGKGYVATGLPLIYGMMLHAPVYVDKDETVVETVVDASCGATVLDSGCVVVVSIDIGPLAIASQVEADLVLLRNNVEATFHVVPPTIKVVPEGAVADDEVLIKAFPSMVAVAIVDVKVFPIVVVVGLKMLVSSSQRSHGAIRKMFALPIVPIVSPAFVPD